MVGQATLRTLREAYVTQIDVAEIPAVATLCKEKGITDDSDIKQVRRVATRDNWEGHRLKRANKFATELAKVEEAQINVMVQELVDKRTQFLRTMIDQIDNTLPSLMAELEGRIDFIDDRALVQAVKLLLDERRSFIKYADARQKAENEKDADGQGKGKGPTIRDFFEEVGLLHRMADAAQGVVSPTDIQDAAFTEIRAEDTLIEDSLAALDQEVADA